MYLCIYIFIFLSIYSKMKAIKKLQSSTQPHTCDQEAGSHLKGAPGPPHPIREGGLVKDLVSVRE